MGRVEAGITRKSKGTGRKGKKLASRHWFRQRVNVAYCSGAGISFKETLEMTDEEVLAAIFIINEIEKEQRESSG